MAGYSNPSATADRVVALAFAVAMAALLYAPMRTAPFVYEDDTLGQPATWSLAGRALSQWSVREESPGFVHLGNVAVHLATGVALVGIGSELVGVTAGIAAAAVFLWHPVMSEAVVYASGRSDLLVTLFIAIALWSGLAWGRRPAWWLALVTAIALVGATFSKEIGGIGVPLVLGTVAYWRWSTVGPLARRAALLTHLLCLAGGVGVGSIGVRLIAWSHLPPGAGGAQFPWPQFVAMQASMVTRLLSFWIDPSGFTIDHDAPSLLASGWLVAGGLLAIVAAIAVVVSWRAFPILAWAIGWVAIALSPRFLFPTNEFVHEYQMYTANLGISLLVGVLASSFLTWQSPEKAMSSWQAQIL